MPLENLCAFRKHWSTQSSLVELMGNFKSIFPIRELVAAKAEETGGNNNLSKIGLTSAIMIIFAICLKVNKMKTVSVTCFESIQS